MALSAKARETLLSRITDVSSGNRNLKLVLYGPPGVGKTTLTAKLSASSFFIMTETGDSVLTKPENKSLKERTKRVPFISFNAIRGYVELLTDGTLDYTQLVLDNASGIQDKKLSQNMEDPTIKDNRGIGRVHPDLTSLQDYQIIAHQMRPMIVDVMDIEAKDTTLICHVRPADPDRGEYQIRPDLTKAIFNLVNEKADVVAYMHKGKNGERLIQTSGTNTVIAKSRITSERIMPVDEFVDEINNWRSSL